MPVRGADERRPENPHLKHRFLSVAGHKGMLHQAWSPHGLPQMKFKDQRTSDVGTREVMSWAEQNRTEAH